MVVQGLESVGKMVKWMAYDRAALTKQSKKGSTCVKNSGVTRELHKPTKSNSACSMS